MHRMISRIISAVFAALFFVQSGLSVSAVNLPDGAVEGLPSALTVMDDSGNAVPEDGEYFFEVTDMLPYTDYTKDIQIMNLRDDKTYHIYFYAEPVSHDGDIDLYGDCKAVFTLNGEEVFGGDVNGNPDDGGATMQESPVDLGSYAPGESGKLTCTVTWEGESADLVVDYGKRLVSKDGTVILEEADEDYYIEGEVYFRWVFVAAVEDDTNSTPTTDSEPTPTTDSDPTPTTDSDPTPTTDSNPTPTTDSNPTPTTSSYPDDGVPHTGVLGVYGTIFVTAAGILLTMIIVFRILIYKKEKNQKQGENDA